MIKRESIQEVIRKVDITEVISQFISIKRRGANYIANCPFHNEKTPSFNINPAKGIFKCFGCGKGGDAIAFIEEYEKFSFIEAIRWLANFYNVELEESEVSEEFIEKKQIEESLRIVNDFAASYFEDNLWKDQEGKIIAGQYFAERGFQEEIIKEFKLGYCKDSWDDFTNHAKKSGYDLEICEQAGLVKTKDGRTYDNYKGRVIFPIFSNTGKILGFGARTLKKNDRAPKYINTPENELYVKNRILYGLFQSRKAINDADECLLVEGYTDVISLHQGGVKNVVSSSGTSLTEGQLKLIKNLTKNLTILYDGDAAGIKAALRGLDMALAEGFTVRLVLLPDGEDPDSFIKKNDEESFKTYLHEHKRDFIEFRLEHGLKEIGSDPVKKSQLVNEIAESISKINRVEDFTLQDHYIRKSAQELKIEEEGLINLVNKFIREGINQNQRRQERKEEQEAEAQAEIDMYSEKTDTSEVDELVKAENKVEWQLLKILLEYGSKPYQEGTVAQYFFDKIDVDIIENPLVKQIVIIYHELWGQNKEYPDIQHFITHENKLIRKKTVDVLSVAHTPSELWTEKYKIELPYGEEVYEEDTKSTFAYFELKFIRRLIQKNWALLEQEKDPSTIEMLLQSHMDLKEKENGLLALVIVK